MIKDILKIEEKIEEIISKLTLEEKSRYVSWKWTF